MASGEPGRLVVTQVTPEVPGEKHIAADCSEKETLKRYCKKKEEGTHWHSNVFMQLFLLYHSSLAEDKVALCRWISAKS